MTAEARTETGLATGHLTEVKGSETGDFLLNLGRQSVTGAFLLVTEDPCLVQGLGLLPGGIVTDQGLRGGSQDQDLLTRKAIARSQGTGIDFPTTGTGLPLLSPRILVTTTDLSPQHVRGIGTISEKTTFPTLGGLDPLSRETDHPMIMTKLRCTLLVPEGPYLPNHHQGEEAQDPHQADSVGTGLVHSADPGGHDHQDPQTSQMVIMLNTGRPRGMASSHHHQLQQKKLSKRIYLMQSATFLMVIFLMTLTMMPTLQVLMMTE